MFECIIIRLVSRETLIQRKVYAVGSVNIFMLDGCHCVFEMTEVTTYGLIYQCCSVCQKENSLFCFTFPKSVDYLKSSVCFSSTRRHHQNNSILTFGHSFYGSIDSYLLIISGTFARWVEKIILFGYFLNMFRLNSLVLLILFPKFFGCGEFVKR